MTEFSNEAKNIMMYMLKELSGMKYGYRIAIEGCYDTAIKNVQMPEPVESKDKIVCEVIRVLNSI